MIFALAGCATRSSATRERPSQPTSAASYRVRAGDTLYSIAWETGNDYHALAQWNGIDPPYLIKPGQLIRLRAPTPDVDGRGYYIVVRGDTLYRIAKAAGVRYQELARWNDIGPPYVLQPGQRLRLSPAEKPSKPPATRHASAASRDPLDRSGNVGWSWPTEGTIVAEFSPSGANKGIDIAGKAGQPIRAAAPGKVVYQGSGLRGYGQLIIVKHNADFLSAYAHCQAIYVQEGSVVKPGQTIATMGSSGTDRVMLHFEIRRNGVPVDPMQHLPKK